MGIPGLCSDFLCCQKLCHAFSFKRCGLFFLLIFMLLVFTIVGLIVLVVIFIGKPQRPSFSLETLRVVSFDLNTCSNSSLSVSSVVSLILTAQNPNKLGIKYSPAQFQLYLEELPVGVMRVPGFNQPAHSNNVNVATRVLLRCVNVSRIISGDLSEDESSKNVIQIKLLGNIAVELQLFQITMPTIKVFLECYVNLDNGQLTFISGINTIRVAQIYNAALPVNHKPLFNKCDIAIYL